MDLTFAVLLALLSIGACAGLLTSSLGVGGSLVVVPATLLLYQQLGLESSAIPVLALGTSLSVSMTNAVFSSWAHYRVGSLTQPFAPEKIGLMAAAGIGALIGASLVSAIPPWFAIAFIAIAQVYFGITMLRHRKAGTVETTVPIAEFKPTALASRAYFALTGFLTSMGAGGGLIVPYLSVRGMPHPQAVGLSAWLTALIGAAALVVFAAQPMSQSLSYSLGAVHIPSVLLISAGSLAAVRFGTFLAHRVDAVVMRTVLGSALLVSRGRLALRALY